MRSCWRDGPRSGHGLSKLTENGMQLQPARSERFAPGRLRLTAVIEAAKQRSMDSRVTCPRILSAADFLKLPHVVCRDGQDLVEVKIRRHWSGVILVREFDSLCLECFQVERSHLYVLRSL